MIPGGKTTHKQKKQRNGILKNTIRRKMIKYQRSREIIVEIKKTNEIN